ncbi:MAG: GNAT family N-acetyltransferase [Rhodospirillaceae bacterium]|nr:GNAT family N-acetyltransferase [Rhodospirillaceae bacterium]|tara:strand:- start:10165 stop:10737 length:573 start_codon:yes stop_codon:yes gene_type:complete
MIDIEITEISSDDDMEKAFEIRRIVFCDEQKVDPEEEFDGQDHECRQYLAKRDGHAVGTARLRRDSPEKTKIERVAVLKEERGIGIGQQLMFRTIKDAREDGAGTVAIHAQCHAEKFYLGLGFERIGDVFEEAGIPHIYMEYRDVNDRTEHRIDWADPNEPATRIYGKLIAVLISIFFFLIIGGIVSLIS